jgi:hypothetical protein
MIGDRDYRSGAAFQRRIMPGHPPSYGNPYCQPSWDSKGSLRPKLQSGKIPGGMTKIRNASWKVTGG